ncbi:MAG: FAD-binding oxidoreductase [Bdellovibrionales bacterium]|nr:FAD-binding oxidoreductase [Bdellovibrionales bacterium]
MQVLNLETTLGKAHSAGGYFKPQDMEQLKLDFQQLIENFPDLYPISRGLNWGYGCGAPISPDSCVVDLSLCQKIKDFDDHHGIVTVEPGVTYQMLYEFLLENGRQWLCPVHGGGPDTSVVGNILERGYGLTPIMDHFSSLISLRALLKDGSEYCSPLEELGQKRLAQLFKYGIGPYTTGLFTQSGLGLVTEVTIKLAPRPQHLEMFVVSVRPTATIEDISSSIKHLKKTYGSYLGGINLMNRERVLSMTMDYPVEKLISGDPLSDDEIKKESQRRQITEWTITGAIYGQKTVVAQIRKELKKELRGVSKHIIFYTSRNQKCFKVAKALFRYFNWEGLFKSIQTMEEGFEVLSGKPNNVALRLAYWKHENLDLKHQVHLNPTKDHCGLIWYAPIVEIGPQVLRQYIEFVQKASLKFNFNPLITLTTLDDVCFDSTIPILFNRNNPKEVQRARNYYEYLFAEGAKLGFFPYRLSIETQKKLNIRPRFLNLDFVSKYRYK